jgi:eukaryotic-like serine/threonine-protein kinase
MTVNKCPHCNTINRDSARFCSNCGEALMGGLSEGSKSSMEQPSLDPQELLHNRYRIEHELGRGGFGAVYRAWDTSLNRPCAVKENLDTSPEAKRQFAREATILANLNHPNLPRVIDHFIIEDQGQYLVMDFVDGEDLASLTEREGVVSVNKSLEWISQVADALSYLHSRKPSVFHRDIKPANIRITPEGKAMLVDFGLVKVSDPNLKTTMGARAVTPGYAPPEQYGQGNTDARTDIYALGATLYKLITGDEPLESVQRMAGKKMIPVHQIKQSVNPQVSQAIEKAMKLEPEERFQNAMQFKVALTETGSTVVVSPERDQPQATVRAVAEAPPIAQPFPEVVKPERKKKPRRLLWVGIIAAVLLCLGSSAIFGLYLIGEQQDIANRTDTADAIQMQLTLQERVKRTSTSSAEIYLEAGELATQAQADRNSTATAAALNTAIEANLATSTAQVISTIESRESLIASLQASGQKVFGPQDGNLEHDREDGLVAEFAPEVSIKNFIVEATFFNPHSSSLAPWNYGFMFRDDEKNDQYRFILEDDSEWVLQNNTGDTEGEIVHQGSATNMNLDEGGSNTIKIIANEDKGYFYLNNVFIAELDLSARMNAGDITIATGFYQDDEVDGEYTGYVGFTIWSLP